MSTNGTNGRPTRHPVLEQLSRDRAGLRERFDVCVREALYNFELLGPEGDEWVATHTPSANLVAWSLERRKYQFACALRAINGMSTGELWPLPEEQSARAAIEGDGDSRSKTKAVRHWRRMQVIQFIDGDEDTPGLDSEDLRAFEKVYNERDIKRTTAFRGAEPGNFSQGTPSPSSEASSSPERAS